MRSKSLVLYALLMPTRPTKQDDDSLHDLNLGNKQAAEKNRSEIEYEMKLADTLASAAKDEDTKSLLVDAVNRKAALRASAATGTITLLTDEEAAAHAGIRKLIARTSRLIRGFYATVCKPIEFGLKEGAEPSPEAIGIEAFD